MTEADRNRALAANVRIETRASRVHTLHDSRLEAFSDGVFWAADEGATAYSETTAQLVEACPEP